MYRPYAQLTDEIIFNLRRNLTSLYDAFFFDPVGLVDIAAEGGYTDLQPFLAKRGAEQWGDLLPIFRWGAGGMGGCMEVGGSGSWEGDLQHGLARAAISE